MTRRRGYLALIALIVIAFASTASAGKKSRKNVRGIGKLPAEKAVSIYNVFERGSRSSDLRARGLSIFGIARVPKKAAGKDTTVFVLDALKDPQWRVRRMAVLALYFAKNKAWRKAMMVGMSDPTLSPEAELFPVLDLLSAKDASAVLMEAVKDPKNPAQNRLTESLVPCVRDYCTKVKTKLGKEGNAKLLDRVQSALPTATRLERIDMLGILLASGRNSAQLPALMMLIDDPLPELKGAIAKVYKKSRDKAVKLEAGIALALLGDTRAAKLLNKSLESADRDTRLRILKGFAEIPESAKEGGLLALLAAGPDEKVDLDYISGVFEIYYRKGKDTPLPRAKMMVDAPDPPTRAVGVRFVAKFEGPVALKSLHALVLDGSVVVRRAAVKAISEFARVDSVEDLGRALNDVDLPVKLAAIEGLGRINDTSVIRHLTFVVGDMNPKVKRAALLALARIHDPAVVPTLQMGLVDPSIEVRSAALKGMMESDPTNARMYFQSALLWLPPPVIREITDAMGAEALPYLKEAAKSDSIETRMLAIDILEDAGEAGLGVLKAVLAVSSHDEVKERVLGILFRVAPADAIALSQGSLEQPGHPGVKVRILEGLSLQGSAEHLPAIEGRLLDTDEVVRVAAAAALLRLYSKSFPAISF